MTMKEGGRERGADQRKEAKFVKMALAAVSTESNQSGWGKGYARARGLNPEVVKSWPLTF